MSSSELDTLQKAFREAGGKWSTFVIWAKNTFTLGRSDYQRQYEPILYGWKDGTDHYWCGARDQGDVWFFDKPHKNDLHPTMKPVALVERAIRNSSKSRDIVLDPFGGSGTTLIAAEHAGRRARLIELDPKYVDVIVQRWQDQTGRGCEALNRLRAKLQRIVFKKGRQHNKGPPANTHRRPIVPDNFGEAGGLSGLRSKGTPILTLFGTWSQVRCDHVDAYVKAPVRQAIEMRCRVGLASTFGVAAR